MNAGPAIRISDPTGGVENLGFTVLRYPRGSNGSAQALIDVRRLADLLASHDDPTAAFAQYEAERRPATAEIVRTNRVSRLTSST